MTNDSITEQPAPGAAASGNQSGNPVVVLIDMPFGSAHCPSIGLGLLKASLNRIAIPARILQFNLLLMERIGEEAYRYISVPNRPADLIGDWLFAPALFGPRSEEAKRRFLEEILLNRDLIPDTRAEDFIPVSDEEVARLLSCQSHIAPFLEDCVRELRSLSPRIVGFTSTFQQHVASLALARRIRERIPDTFLVMGGANCEEDMGAETLRSFPFIDAVVSGEGDHVFPELVGRILNNNPLDGLDGVLWRDGFGIRIPAVGSARVPDLDSLPLPDFDDYFIAHAASREKLPSPALMLETSRGCWWGQKSPCRFCGINHHRMSYRNKSAPHALEELLFLTERYPVSWITMVDSVIPPAYFRNMLPKLVGQTLPGTLFYEIRPNETKSRLKLMRDAGVHCLQAGIESFSDQVLEVMNKGVRALENIQLIKWCRQLGISIKWNLLWGMPGEDPAEYATIAEVIPWLTYLEPPVASGRFQLHRFSSFFEETEKWGLRNPRPAPAYYHVYSLPEDSIRNLAYYHVFDYADGRDVSAYVRPVWEQILSWWRVAENSGLFMTDTADRLIVFDLRPVAVRPITVLKDLPRYLLLACEGIRTEAELRKTLDEMPLPGPPEAELESALKKLQDLKFLLQMDHRYLALPLPLGEYSPPAALMQRFLNVLSEQGAAIDGSCLVIPTQ
jgi:ribosomal peptide maturation radical SAM protein 1